MKDQEFKSDFDEEEPVILNIVLEDGEELPSEVIGIFEVDGKEYIALLPENDDRVLLYIYEELNDEDVDLQNIEDDQEFERVTEAFWEIFSDEDFEPDED